MIDIKRAVLYGLLMLVIYTLWMDWQKDYPPVKQNPVASLNTAIPNKETPSNSQEITPLLSSSEETVHENSPVDSSINTKDSLFFVKTDVFKLGFDKNTGDLVSATLTDYKKSIQNKEPFVMLNNDSPLQYITSMRLFSLDKETLGNIHFMPKTFHVEKNKKGWVVSVGGSSPEGLSIKKEFMLEKNSYLIGVRYFVTNNNHQPWEGEWTTQLSQKNPVEDKSSLFHLGSYSGGAISMPGDKLYKKISYEDMAESSLDQKVKDGWVAMQQHYFLTAWIPSVGTTNKFYTQVSNDTYTIGVLSEPVKLNSGETYEFSSRLYVGPELMDALKKIAPGLELTIDYGWLSAISVVLFFILEHIYNFLGNWGWSIILVTVLIKLAFYKLSAKSYSSMANMRKLQPKLEELKQRFSDDKTKISQATMELYRKEKVNPLGGCLPIVVQIPVFIALYWVLLESIQLRQAPFIFWIHDLSVSDPYYILPIIMGFTMLVQQKLNPPPPDPMQAKVMMFLPVLFTGLFLHFPAGLVLYWVVNNTLSIVQQWYITQKINNQIIKKRFSHGKLIGQSKKSDKHDKANT